MNFFRVSVAVGMVLLAGLPFVCSCSPKAKIERLKEECSVQVSDVRVEAITLLNMELAVDLVILNPTSESLTAKKITYTISLNDVKVGHGMVEQELELVKMGETAFTLPVNISLISLTGGAERILTERRAECTVEGYILIDLFLADFQLPFQVRKEVLLK